MNVNNLINLTKALYRVTDSFPDNEPLKYSLRAKSIKILSNAVPAFPENNEFSQKKNLAETIREIRIIRIYFEVAERQSWIRPENFLVLGEEYLRLEKELEKAYKEAGKKITGEDEQRIEKEKKERIENSKTEDYSVTRKKTESSGGRENNDKIKKIKNERQKKILEILKKRDYLQVKDLKEIFPSISKRTIRRDFVYLLKLGIIGREGKKNETIYKINRK